ncbi:MAG: hypothetical protein R6X31_12415 [Anaerolineae bacterium]
MTDLQIITTTENSAQVASAVLLATLAAILAVLSFVLVTPLRIYLWVHWRRGQPGRTI